jgi:hypothetical protein
MKKITMLNLLWLMFSPLAIAQSSVVDYYFSTEKTTVLEHRNNGMVRRYGFSSSNNSTGFLVNYQELNGKTISKLTQKLKISKDKIQVVEEISESSLFGDKSSSYGESEKIALMLPKIGAAAKWKEVRFEGKETYTYEAKLVSVCPKTCNVQIDSNLYAKKDSNLFTRLTVRKPERASI